MRAQRIKTGFHRVGIMLVIICLVPAAITLGLGLLLNTGTDSYWLCTATRSEALPIFMMAAAWLMAAATAYPLARGIGWAVAGFIGDGLSN